MMRMYALGLSVTIALVAGLVPLTANAELIKADVAVNSTYDYVGPNEYNSSGDASTGQHAAAVEFVAPAANDYFSHGDIWSVAYLNSLSSIVSVWTYAANPTDGGTGTVLGTYSSTFAPGNSLNRAGHTYSCGTNNHCAWFVGHNRATPYPNIFGLRVRYNAATGQTDTLFATDTTKFGYEPAGDSARWCTTSACAAYEPERFLVVWVNYDRTQLRGQLYDGTGAVVGSAWTIYSATNARLARPQVVTQMLSNTDARFMITVQGNVGGAEKIGTFFVETNGYSWTNYYTIDTCAATAGLSCHAMWLSSSLNNSQNAAHYGTLHMTVDNSGGLVDTNTLDTMFTPVAGTDQYWRTGFFFYDIGWSVAPNYGLDAERHDDSNYWDTSGDLLVDQVSTAGATAQGIRKGTCLYANSYCPHTLGTIYTREDVDYRGWYLYFALLRND